MSATVTPQQIITSGVLEAYLLGLTSDEDETAVGQLVAASPELTAYLSDLEADLGNHFLHHSVPPPPAVRDVVELQVTEQEIQKNSRSRYGNAGRATAYTDTAPKPNYVDVEVDNTHIRVHKYWRPAFIAVFILGKIFLATALYFYFKADSQAQEINRLKAEISHTVRN